MRTAPSFALVRARGIAEAVSALAASPTAAVLAGGLSLVPQMRARRRRPGLLVDINHVPGLGTVTVSAGADEAGNETAAPATALVAGAAARQRDVLAAALSRPDLPAHQLLATALTTMGTGQVRGRGTLVGAIAHGDPAAQPAAVCAVTEASVTVAGDAGERVLAASALFSSAAPLRRGELITSVRFPGGGGHEGWGFMRTGRREIGATAGGVAVLMKLDEERHRCRWVRAAPFVRGHDGSPLTAVADVLTGVPVHGEAFERAAERAAELAAAQVGVETDALASADYRRHLVRVGTRRCLLEAARRAARPAGRGLSR